VDGWRIGKPDIIGAPASFHVLASGVLPYRDIRLVSMLPHMHVRGKNFEFRPSGERETLLRLSRYDFTRQINYYLATPKLLPEGTIIECAGHYHNSPNNPHPKIDLTHGEQAWKEMLNGFMEIAIEPVTETPPLLGEAPAPLSR
jgi:hypothetical protein